MQPDSNGARQRAEAKQGVEVQNRWVTHRGEVGLFEPASSHCANADAPASVAGEVRAAAWRQRLAHGEASRQAELLKRAHASFEGREIR